ncbi:MAG: CDP-glycerol glycerophosphotransferase family protein [Clostridiales bacterium]|nr:CDP-glycerol glycerophosphotransferase family protein [Clostridiales bacterium]
MAQPNDTLQTLSLPIVATERALQVELVSPAPGEALRMTLRCTGGSFPEGGAYYLRLSNQGETAHWYAPASVEGNQLTADLTSVAALFAGQEEPMQLTVSLAHTRGKGLVICPLRGGQFRPVLDKGSSCPYLMDNRAVWGGPVAAFPLEGVDYVALPHFVRGAQRRVNLVLDACPQSLRYWGQIRYGIDWMELRGGRFLLSVIAPEGAPGLRGISIHRASGSEAGQTVYPVQAGRALFVRKENPQLTGRILEPCWAEVPLPTLLSDGEPWRISGVYDGGDGRVYHVPLCIVDEDSHQRMGDLANSLSLTPGPLCCGLQITGLGSPMLSVSEQPPYLCQQAEADTLEEALARELLLPMGNLFLRDRGGSDWKWRFSVANLPLNGDTELMMLAVRKDGTLYFPVSVVDGTGPDNVLEADFSALPGLVDNTLPTQWRLRLAIRRGRAFGNAGLRIAARTVRTGINTEKKWRSRFFTYGAPFGDCQMMGQTLEALVCCPQSGDCSLSLGDQMRRYERQMVCRAEVHKLRGTRLKLRVQCPNLAPGTWDSFALVYRYKQEEARQVYFFPAKRVRKGTEYTELTADFDLSRLEFAPLYWDIRTVFHGRDGVAYTARINPQLAKEQRWCKTEGSPLYRLEGQVRRVTDRISAQVERLFHSSSYRQGEDMSVSLYKTLDKSYALVCQAYSPYCGFRFRVKERLALVLSKVFRRRLAYQHIFLCYEKYGSMAQDNGFYFFRHCMENGMEEKMHRNIYFIIDKSQPDYQERLLPYKDHVIQFMSLKHMVYILAARLLISSDSKAHAYAWRAKESVILPRINHGKKLVFLQHGVIALKKVNFFWKSSNSADLFITSNQREYGIICQYQGYPPENVVVTGLARWDVLEDKPIPEKRILLMPTWRNWLEEVTDEAFVASDYYKNYMALINDPRLEGLLEQYDLYLDFYIHPKFREYMAQFSISGNPRVRMIPFGSAPLNQLMMECRMLVTDYSSVCWDVYYQKKPVLFYQFDVEQYNETTGSYIDLNTELFGDQVLTPEALLEKLEEYAKSGFALPERYAAMQPSMYEYVDRNNSQRICEEIMKRGW